MRRIKGKLVLALLLVAMWVLLAHPVDTQELWAAVIVAVVVAAVAAGSDTVFADIRLTPKAALYALIYAGVFIAELMKANLDVASRVVRPTLPIRPGIVKVKTGLQSRLGRLLLSGSITLTPGTITVDTEGDTFYIHWIAVEGDEPEIATERIVKKFERYLEVICG